MCWQKQHDVNSEMKYARQQHGSKLSMHGRIFQAERFLFLSNVTEYWVTLHMSKTEKQ